MHHRKPSLRFWRMSKARVSLEVRQGYGDFVEAVASLINLSSFLKSRNICNAVRITSAPPPGSKLIIDAPEVVGSPSSGRVDVEVVDCSLSDARYRTVHVNFVLTFRFPIHVAGRLASATAITVNNSLRSGC